MTGYELEFDIFENDECIDEMVESGRDEYRAAFFEYTDWDSGVNDRFKDNYHSYFGKEVVDLE